MENDDADCKSKSEERIVDKSNCISDNDNTDENVENNDQCTSQFLKCKPKDKSIPPACDENRNKHKVLERTTNKNFSDSDCSSRDIVRQEQCEKLDVNDDVSDNSASCAFRDHIEAYLNQDEIWVISWRVRCPQTDDFIALCPPGT